MHCCIKRRSRRKSGKRSFRRVVTVATVSGRNRKRPGRGSSPIRYPFCLLSPRVVLLEPTSLRRESEANEQRGRSDKKTIDDCFSCSRAKAVLLAPDVVRVQLGESQKRRDDSSFFISWHLSEKVDDILILWFFIPFIVLKHRIAFNTFDIENIVIKRYN